MPRKKELEILHNDMENCKDQPQLRSWSERFAAADTQQFKPGETIRILATHQELVKRALMWLQREYLAKFRYDPTSDRDEDLPVDLDHIVPASTFYFNWGDRGLRLEEGVDLLNFREERSNIGDLLGNRRWLDASENRRRQNGPYDLDGVFDVVEPRVDDWKKLADGQQRKWANADIALFQHLVDARTLDLYRNLLENSCIESLLPAAKAEGANGD